MSRKSLAYWKRMGRQVEAERFNLEAAQYVRMGTCPTCQERFKMGRYLTTYCRPSCRPSRNRKKVDDPS